MENALIIFAKPPIAGHAKTRLIPALGAEGAAKLHAELLLKTMNNNTQSKNWDSFLWCASHPHDPVFNHCHEKYNVILKQQINGDLGQRMYHAITETLKNHQRVIIIGTDCPVLNKTIIEDGFQSLPDADDVLIIPAEDGGYVLLGVNKTVMPQLFERINWGSDEVFQKSLQNIVDLDLNPVIKTTLWDVDDPDDLKRYYALAMV